VVQSYVAPIRQCQGQFTTKRRRRRKLLVFKKQLSHLWNGTQRKGMDAGADGDVFQPPWRWQKKLKIAIAKGKKLHDKRETAAKR